MRHARRTPIVLPFFHSGMGDVMPRGAAFPRVGKKVHVNVGEPIDLTDLACNCNKPDYDQQKVRCCPARVTSNLVSQHGLRDEYLFVAATDMAWHHHAGGGGAAGTRARQPCQHQSA